MLKNKNKNSKTNTLLSQELFNKTLREFKKIEDRQNFYEISNNLKKKGFEIESYLLLLTTWNFASFRYAIKSFNMEKFKKAISVVKTEMKKIQSKNFKDFNFDSHTDKIKKMYNVLCRIKGIEHTGASKILHLANPEVFVIWDAYIRGEKVKRHYRSLKINFYKNGHYEKSYLGYLKFLNEMKIYYKDIEMPKDSKITFAKAIDECNYFNITLPIQHEEKIERNKKRKEKKLEKIVK